MAVNLQEIVEKYAFAVSAIIRCSLCIWLLAMAACTSDDQVKPLKPLRVATGNWEPFVGEHLIRHGPMAEMMSTILADLGYVPEFQFYDWRMVEKHLKAGYPGIAFPMIKSMERTNEKYLFSEPMHTFNYVLFYLKERATEFSSINSLEDLERSGLKIGRIRGYARLHEITGNENYVEVPSAAEGFAMLRDGNAVSTEAKKIDFLLESRSVGLRTLASETIARDHDDFTYLGQNHRQQLISKVSLRVMLSPKVDPAILPLINNSLKENKDFFDSLRARANSQSSTTARLTAPDGHSIWGYLDNTAQSRGIMVPRNSRVLINEWGESYTRAADTDLTHPDLGKSRVKLLSGPARGKVLWVEDRYITLER